MTVEQRGSPSSLGPRADPAVGPRPVTARTFRLVRVASVGVELPEQYPVVVLEDSETGGDRLQFRIGTAEGVALAHALRGTRAPRPLTAELLGDALDRFGIEVLAVRLTGRVGATYLAELDLIGPGGRQVLTCRPSDGLCLALGRRVPAPVLADARLFVETGDVDDHPADPAGTGGTEGRPAG